MPTSVAALLICIIAWVLVFLFNGIMITGSLFAFGFIALMTSFICRAIEDLGKKNK